MSKPSRIYRKTNFVWPPPCYVSVDEASEKLPHIYTLLYIYIYVYIQIYIYIYIYIYMYIYDIYIYILGFSARFARAWATGSL